ncbi:MAG: threonylcarbamoyl-AMP synthase [Alphaproteobacteria bacterium]|nr:MAG: threonylcarbamoyl-AMP synthase [Alphaproteobacteria bacterium]
MGSIVTTILPNTEEARSYVCRELYEGRCVVLPTETVYGLAADARSDSAVLGIYEIKNRPSFNPLILHGTDVEMLEEYVVFNERARMLAALFWPGGLTMVLPAKTGSVSPLACAGLDTLAVRVPNHSIFLQVITAFGRPLVAPSANPSNYLSATSASDVAAGFAFSTHESPLKKALPILDGGVCAQGVESTIIDLTTSVPTLLRPGAITIENLQEVMKVTSGRNTSSIKAPGQLKTHYAPHAPLRQEAKVLHPGEVWVGFGPIPSHIAAIIDDPHNAEIHHLHTNLSQSGDLKEAAQHLFHILHSLDASYVAQKPLFKGVAVAKIPQKGLGLAINDRLKRANQKT